MSDEAANRRAPRVVGRRLEGLDPDRVECFDEVFDGLSLARCSSHDADFLRASLREAIELQFTGVRFDNAAGDATDWRGCEFVNVRFEGTSLKAAHFDEPSGAYEPRVKNTNLTGHRVSMRTAT